LLLAVQWAIVVHVDVRHFVVVEWCADIIIDQNGRGSSVTVLEVLVVANLRISRSLSV